MIDLISITKSSLQQDLLLAQDKLSKLATSNDPIGDNLEKFKNTLREYILIQNSITTLDQMSTPAN